MLILRFKKRPDANALLVLVREDGSSSRGEIGPAHGYGPVHDLAHYVAERTLGLHDGFLGLVAGGWEIADFEVKGTARQLPDEALLAEAVAGELARQEMMGQYATAEDFIWALGAVMANMRGDVPALTRIDERTLVAMRTELSELRARWHEVEPGGTLEFLFPVERPAGSAARARPVAAE